MKPQTKARMLSNENSEYLFYHVFDGFASSDKGIKNLKATGLIADDEYTELLEKNSQRLIDRIKKFKIAQKLLCIVFAIMFGYLQVNGEDLEMRRARRASRGGKRKSESEMPVYV